LLKTRALILQRRGAHREAADLFEIATALTARFRKLPSRRFRLALGDAAARSRSAGRWR
jgi:hypothetical protein